MKNKLIRYATLLVLALTAASPRAAAAKLKVVATVPSLAAIAHEIGGDLVDVQSLSSPSEDPHFVDPRPNLVLELNRADLLAVNGLELEVGWLPPLQTAARNSAITVGGEGYFDASRFVHRLDVPAGKVDRGMGDVHPGGNPHFLADPRAGSRVAAALAEKMASLDPQNRDRYFAGAKALMAKLDAVARKEITRFSSLPAERRRVVSYHKSFPYLYDWLGLDEVITIEPRPGISPDPGQVARVLSTMRETGARVIVQEVYYPANTASTLARLAKATVVKVPGGARFSDGQRYSDFIAGIAEELHAALTD